MVSGRNKKNKKSKVTKSQNQTQKLCPPWRTVIQKKIPHSLQILPILPPGDDEQMTEQYNSYGSEFFEVNSDDDS